MPQPPGTPAATLSSSSCIDEGRCLLGTLLVQMPLTADFSAWYAGSVIFALVSVAALAIYGFHTTLAGRPVFKGER